MSHVHRESTDLIEERQRLSFWRAGSHRIGGVEVSAVENSGFQGKVALRDLGTLTVFGLEAGPHRINWTHDHIRDRESFVRIRFQRNGTSVIKQHGKHFRIAAGQWSVIDGSHPYCIVSEEDISQISLQIPRSKLPDSEFERVCQLRGPFPTTGSVGHLLYHCLRLVIEDLEDERTSTDQMLGETMFDMFRVIIARHAHARIRSSIRETSEQRVRVYIRRNLTNPDLSIELIADAMKCSRRYIHKLFEGQETVSQFIWSQRLEACRQQIIERASGEVTLTELAFEHGFRSSAHFSRAFNVRYGISPRAFRKQVLADRSDGHAHATGLTTRTAQAPAVSRCARIAPAPSRQPLRSA